MKTIALILTFQVFWINNTIAQNEVDHEQVHDVYLRILQATGYAIQDMPVLEISHQRNCSRPIACFKPGKPGKRDSILIDAQALNICFSIDTNAEAGVAFILGHELAHFFQKRIWNQTLPKLIDLACEVTLDDEELQADLYGLFITRQVNYQPNAVLEELLIGLRSNYLGQQIYQKELKQLSCRASLADSICQLVDHLWTTNELGNWLMALQDPKAYEAAAEVYRYLAQYIIHPEIQNNIGLAHLFMALSTASNDPEWKQFKYPILLDWDNPTRRRPEKRKQLLNKAERHLLQGHQLAPEDIDIAINLACLKEIQGQYPACQELIDSLSKKTHKTEQQTSQLAILSGIMAAHQGNLKKAERKFKQSQRNTTPWKKISNENLKILEGKPPSTDKSPKVVDHLDGIPNISRHTLPRNRAPVLSLSKSIRIDKEQFDHSSFYRVSFGQFETKVNLHFTNNDHLETQNGIKVGDSLVDLERAYKSIPLQYSLTHSQGYYLMYPSQGLVFNMSVNNKVRGWGTYKIH